MKNIIKKSHRDVMAEARESKKFQEYSKDAALRLRLAVEVYNSREKLDLSQQKLAKEIGSTQKVVSKIESGDVNVGIELLSRVSERLNFDSDAFARIFSCRPVWLIKIQSGESQVNEERKIIKSNVNIDSYYYQIK